MKRVLCGGLEFVILEYKMLLGVCLSTAMELFKDYHLAIISACDNEMFSLCMLFYRKQRCPVGDEKKY